MEFAITCCSLPLGPLMKKINVLLLCGGKSSEHEVSLRSAAFIRSSLASVADFELKTVVMEKDGSYTCEGNNKCQLSMERQLISEQAQPWPIDFVIPCIHGYPGESGDLQSYLEMIELAYLGCNPEASKTCFNKVTTKLWLSTLGIPNTPYVFISDLSTASLAKCEQALADWGSLFIKASSQGSSVGCYKVEDKAELRDVLEKAFSYSPHVLVEKTIHARELEIASYEYQGESIATLAGEIVCPKDTFYTYDEKYASDSHSETQVVAQNISTRQMEELRYYARKAFAGLKLRHLSRIDFFLTDDGQIYLNEINTFPGMTAISMFPKMMANHGHSFTEFLTYIIKQETQR